MLHDHFGTTGKREPDPRWRPTRALLIFGLASFAVHAAVIVALPDFFQGPGPANVSMLEVTVLKIEPLPVAEAQPESIPSRLPSEPKSRPTHTPLKTERKQSPPVLALSKPEPAPEDSFAVAPARLPEPSQPASGTKPQAASAAVVPPSVNAAYLSNPAPRYPLASRRAGEQGTVTLRVLVKPDGYPAQVEIERTSGSPHLDAAALEAVRGWRFVPARQGANPVESRVLVPVVFRLEGAS